MRDQALPRILISCRGVLIFVNQKTHPWELSITPAGEDAAPKHGAPAPCSSSSSILLLLAAFKRSWSRDKSGPEHLEAIGLM